jgi:FkbM family methyltransferase
MVGKQLIRQLIERYLDRRGYELKDKATPLIGLRGFCERARSRGFAPAGIVDIGVGYGTPWLYETFPDATLTLIEPLKEFESDLKRICQQYRGTYHLCAVGKEPGEITIQVNEAYPTSSGQGRPTQMMKDRFKAANKPLSTVERKVPITTLDALQLPATSRLIKIDTEGHEMDVIAGGRKLLATTEMVIAEVSVAPRYEGGYEFAQFIAAMRELEFGLVDIPDMGVFAHSGTLHYIDAAFVRTTSPLRALF